MQTEPQHTPLPGKGHFFQTQLAGCTGLLPQVAQPLMNLLADLHLSGPLITGGQFHFNAFSRIRQVARRRQLNGTVTLHIHQTAIGIGINLGQIGIHTKQRLNTLGQLAFSHQFRCVALPDGSPVYLTAKHFIACKQGMSTCQHAIVFGPSRT